MYCIVHFQSTVNWIGMKKDDTIQREVCKTSISQLK
jgi:hypothetical protein